MRKLALLLFTVSVIICSAESFVGLMFTDQIGTSIAVALDGLNITYIEDKAVITNSSGTTELPLASLASMQFTTTLSASDIVVGNEPVDVFSTTGVCEGRFSSIEAAKVSLNSGIYIVKSASAVIKIAVK